ncbi:MAG: hypothetical protein N2506_06875 [Dehalococcoidales bacterium]|nr:hypothetical protein [Dehalococcoidales bacterium]
MRTDKYIVTEVRADKLFPGEPRGLHEVVHSGFTFPTHVAWLDGEVVPGAFYVEAVWVWPGCASERPAAEAHRHDFPEAIGFFGTDFYHPRDLGGEVELWLDGERHVMTQSFVAFVPAGMEHCPLIMRRVERPIFHFAMGLGSRYER